MILGLQKSNDQMRDSRGGKKEVDNTNKRGQIRNMEKGSKGQIKRRQWKLDERDETDEAKDEDGNSRGTGSMTKQRTMGGRGTEMK